MNRNIEILKKFIDNQSQRLQDDISRQGYKDNSPYKNNPSNTIYGTPQGTPITMKGVSTPLIGMDEFGNKQNMQPGQEYFFPGTQVTETRTAKYGGLLNKTVRCSNCGWSWKAADGGNDVSSCHKCGTQVDELLKAQYGLLQTSNSRQKRGLDLLIIETENAKKDKQELITTGQIKNPRSIAYKSKVKKQPELNQDNRSDVVKKIDEAKGQAIENKKQFRKNVIAPLDVATDIMQLGNFIPEPNSQTIGKIGNVAGMAIDAYQAYDDLSEGNYADAAINAGSVFLPMGLDSKTFRRNSKYLQPGQPLYPFSPQARNNFIDRVHYIEPFTKVKGMTDTSLLANRALLGTLGAETVYDMPHYQQGGLAKAQYGDSVSRFKAAMAASKARGYGNTPNQAMLSTDKRTQMEREADARLSDKELERKARMRKEILAQSRGQFNSTQDFKDANGAIDTHMRVSLNDNVFDDYLNPAAWVGSMANKLGAAPDNINKGNYGEAAMAFAEPLAFGAGEKVAGPMINKYINSKRVLPIVGNYKVPTIAESWGKYEPLISESEQIAEPYISRIGDSQIGEYVPFKEDEYIKWFNEQKAKSNPSIVKQDPRSILRSSSIIDMNDKGASVPFGMVQGDIPKFKGFDMSAIENIDGDKVFYDTAAKENFPTGEFKYINELAKQQPDQWHGTQSFNSYYKNQNWKPNINDIPMNKYGGLTKAQYGESVIENTQVGTSRDKRGLALQMKEHHDALKDEHELHTTGQVKRPRSVKYKQNAVKAPEVKTYIPDSTLSKIGQSMVTPFTALTDLYQKGEVRDNLIKSVINNPKSANAYDAAYLGALGYALPEIGMAASPYVAPIIAAGSNMLGANAFGVAGLNAGNAINAGFATHGAMNMIPNIQKGNWFDAGTNALEMLPAVGPITKSAVEGVNATKNMLSNIPRNVRNTVGSQLMDYQISRGLPKPIIPQLPKIDLSKRAAINIKNDAAKEMIPEDYDNFLEMMYNKYKTHYDNPIVEYKGIAKPRSFFDGLGNTTFETAPGNFERFMEGLGIPTANTKEGKLFKEKFCPPGSECAKSANAVTSKTFTDITGTPFNAEENAHNAWHMEDQMTRHGGKDVSGFNLKVGDRILMGNGVDQSTNVAGYNADRSVRHAGMYAGMHRSKEGTLVPLIFESGKNNAMFINPLTDTFTGPHSALKSIRPSQFLDETFGKALVDKNLRYAFRDKPSIATYSSGTETAQNILNDSEKFREVTKRTHDITNDEFDELRNSLIGIGAQETKLNGSLPGSSLSKAKIQIQNKLNDVGLTKPIKQTINTVKQILNDAPVESSLPKFPGTSVLEMEAAKLSHTNKIPFEDALKQVKNNYQVSPKYISSTPTPSKGMFRQKFQTDADKFSGVGKDLKNKNSIENGLGQMAENYNKIKKAYPNASNRQLIDLTTLMWNSPGKALNPKLVDFYLFGKQNPDPSKFNFDYIRKINEAKNKLINIHPARGASQYENYEQIFRNGYPEIQYKKGGTINNFISQ